MARHIGKTPEELERDTNRDNFMDGFMAVKYGLIDAIVAKRD
jgi:ATP-dependent Clp protease protease subunit